MGLSWPVSLAVPCQRATDLARLATLRRWAIAASLRPLGVRKYALGSQSCDAGLICVRLLVVSRQIGRAWHLWWCSPRGASSRAFSVGARSRSRSGVRLEAPSSASIRGAFLRCGMRGPLRAASPSLRDLPFESFAFFGAYRLEKLASRREYDASSPVASLNSTLAPPPASNVPFFSADAGMDATETKTE